MDVENPPDEVKDQPVLMVTHFQVELTPEQYRWKLISFGVGLLSGLLLLSLAGVGLMIGLSAMRETKIQREVDSMVATAIARFPVLTLYCDIPRNVCQSCPDQWILRDSSCYYFSTDARNWAESRFYCIEHGADLVVIENLDEQEFLLNNVQDFARNHSEWLGTWIGLTDVIRDTEMYWVDGHRPSEDGSFWAGANPTLPKNWNIKQPDVDCVVVGLGPLGPNGTIPKDNWNIVFCKSSHHFICEGDFLNHP